MNHETTIAWQAPGEFVFLKKDRAPDCNSPVAQQCFARAEVMRKNLATTHGQEHNAWWQNQVKARPFFLRTWGGIVVPDSPRFQEKLFALKNSPASAVPAVPGT